MRNLKLSILACGVVVGIGFSTQNQPAPDSSDDQAKVLEALRQAESQSAQQPPAKEKKKPAKKKKAEANPEAQTPPPAPSTPSAVITPATVAAAPASTPDQESGELQALHQAEHVQPAP